MDNPNYLNVYTKIMFNMARMNPTIDLATVTKQEIYYNNYQFVSVLEAIINGLLEPISDNGRLNAQI